MNPPRYRTQRWTVLTISPLSPLINVSITTLTFTSGRAKFPLLEIQTKAAKNAWGSARCGAHLCIRQAVFVHNAPHYRARECWIWNAELRLAGQTAQAMGALIWIVLTPRMPHPAWRVINFWNGHDSCAVMTWNVQSAVALCCMISSLFKFKFSINKNSKDKKARFPKTSNKIIIH